MKITLLDSETALWDDFVLRQPAARYPHLCGWKKVIEESFGHSCFYLMAKENGAVHGILPLVHIRSRLFGSFLISLPFLNYGGIVAAHAEAQQSLFDSARDLATERGAAYIELRHEAPLLEEAPTKQHKVTMRLDLPDDPEILWNQLKSTVRTQIRKPKKLGLAVRFGREEELTNFYEVFSANMRDLGTPVYSKNFFTSILKNFPASTWICSVLMNGQAIASGLVCGFRETLEIPWASSLRRYNSLAANMLLYWSVLEFAVEKGFKCFDFGRCSPDEGTYKFKAQWGSKPAPLHWQYWLANGHHMPDLSPKNDKYQLAIRLWQKLPLFVTRLVGPAIIRNIP